MNLKDLIAKVTSLAAKVDASLRDEVNALKAQVDGALTDAMGNVSDLTAKVASLEAAKAELEGQNATLTANLSEKNKELLGFNDLLADACLQGGLLDLKLAADATPEQTRAAALAVPMADKFKAYQGALNTAFAKANLPNSTLPKAPEAPVGQSSAHAMKREAYFKLSPSAQLEFVKNGGKITD